MKKLPRQHLWQNKPRGVRSSMQIAPPSITKPFSIRGSTTRMNGGANGKLSGNIRWRRMHGVCSSTMSWAKGDSGSIWKSRTCHSNKLSSINSTYLQTTWGFKFLSSHSIFRIHSPRTFSCSDRSVTFALLETLSLNVSLERSCRFSGRPTALSF